MEKGETQLQNKKDKGETDEDGAKIWARATNGKRMNQTFFQMGNIITLNREERTRVGKHTQLILEHSILTKYIKTEEKNPENIYWTLVSRFVFAMTWVSYSETALGVF